MNEPKLCGRLLTQLFRRSQASESIDILSLAQEADASVLAACRAMAALERAGLADARRLRLTLSGLALAAAFSARRAGSLDADETRGGAEALGGAGARSSRPVLSACDAA